MQVTVKCVSMEGALPKGFDEWGEASVDLATGATLEQLLDKIALKDHATYMTLINGESVVASERATHALGDGDELAIFPPIQGGAGEVPHFRKLFMENSQERLTELVTRRCEPHADKKAIDEKIWKLFGEDWTVMFTDLSGFSRSAAKFGIVHFIATIIQSERLFAPILEDHGAFILKREGDSLMILFHDPRQSLDCALAMQRACQAFSADKPDEDKVILGLGLSHGKILRLGSNEAYGEAVNSASKLGEDTAGPNDVLVTDEFIASLGPEHGLELEPIDFVPPGSTGAFKVVY